MEILKKTKEILSTLVDVTEAGSKIARYKIEVANLDRKLGLAYKRVGERIYSLFGEDIFDVADDAEILDAFEEVRKIRDRMEVIHDEVGAARETASSEWDRAAKAVKEEAGRATKAVKKEAGRATKAVKKEAGRAATLIKDEKERATAALRKASGSDKAKKAPAKKAPAKKAPAKK
jgi:hypothetical protein